MEDVKIRVDRAVYYQNKRKFVKLYGKLKMVWIEETEWGNGWFSPDWESFLLKLKEYKGYKRFFAHNCELMVQFLKEIGGREETKAESDEAYASKDEEPVYNIREFVGADLWQHRRLHEVLAEMPDNWGVEWT